MTQESSDDVPSRARYPLNRGQRRRRRLISAAAEIYREEGRDGVTQRAVAKRADSSLSAMTYYFEDLLDMIEAAVRQGLRDRIRLLVRQTADPGSLGATAADAIVEVLVPHETPARPWRYVENLTGAGEVPTMLDQFEHLSCHEDAALAAIWQHFQVAAPAAPRQMAAMVNGVVALTLPPHDPREAARRLVSEYLALPHDR